MAKASTAPNQTTNAEPAKLGEAAMLLHRQTLNYNVLARYDPKINQLLYTSSHCVVYKYASATEEWEKSDYQGVLMLYSRNYDRLNDPANTQKGNLDSYAYGIVVLNRSSPANFSIGVIPRTVSVARRLIEMEAYISGEYLIVKNSEGKTYGLWIFDEKDRQPLTSMLEFCLSNEPVPTLATT